METLAKTTAAEILNELLPDFNFMKVGNYLSTEYALLKNEGCRTVKQHEAVMSIINKGDFLFSTTNPFEGTKATYCSFRFIYFTADGYMRTVHITPAGQIKNTWASDEPVMKSDEIEATIKAVNYISKQAYSSIRLQEFNAFQAKGDINWVKMADREPDSSLFLKELRFIKCMVWIAHPAAPQDGVMATFTWDTFGKCWRNFDVMMLIEPCEILAYSMNCFIQQQ